MKKFVFVFALMCAGGTARASDVGFGIDTGTSTIPRSMLGAFFETRNIPPTYGSFVEVNCILYNKTHHASWIFSLGNGVFYWGNSPSLKGTNFDVSGDGQLTAVSVEKQVNVYTKPRYDLHFRTGVGAGKLITDLDGASLAMLLRHKTESGYVPLMRASGGVAYHPNDQIAFGLDTGWGYFWEEYRLSVSCRF